MEFIDILNNSNQINPVSDPREPSASHEGSDSFIFEDLLGNYNQNDPIKQKQQIIKQESFQSAPPNKNNGNDISPDAIKAIFDDIFDIHEEISIFTDDDDDDLESTQEGYDVNNTTFTMPSDPKSDITGNQLFDDPFDAIMKDLDEKTQELEHKKPKKKKKSNQKPSPLSPELSETEHVQVNASVIPENVQCALDKWEYDNKGQRKDIITLLSSLQNVLPECVVNKWKEIKLSGLLNDSAVRKGYLKGVRLVHPDKCIQNGYDEVSKLICNQIFQGLEQAWSKK